MFLEVRAVQPYVSSCTNSFHFVIGRRLKVQFLTKADMLALAHLSDVHLGPLPRPRLGEISIKRALGFANWHRKRKRVHLKSTLDQLVSDLKTQNPDHIAVTGDLVNIGLPSEFVTAARWLATLGPPEYVTVVPGNHDAYVRLRSDPGLLRWADYMRGHEPEFEPSAGNHFPFVKRIGKVALIGTSSAVPTPPLVAAGWLGAKQLKALKHVLFVLGQQGCFRVLLIHHPPLPGQAQRLRGLTDAQALADVLGKVGAELILHGHDHRHILAWADGPHGRIPAVGVPSGSALGQGHDMPARYNLFKIATDSHGWHLEMIARGYDRAGQTIREIEHSTLSVPGGGVRGDASGKEAL